MNERKYGALSSSVNPQELSLTVTSIAKVIIGMLVGFGVFTTTGADTTLTQIPVIVSAGYATWQAAEALWGAVRKVIVAVTAR